MGMIKYTVKTKQPGDWFWRKYKNVVGDGCEAAYRFINLEDGTQIHFPYFTTIRFSGERILATKAKMEKDIGQKIVTKG